MRNLKDPWPWIWTGNRFDFTLTASDSVIYYGNFKLTYGTVKGIKWQTKEAFDSTNPLKFPSTWWTPDCSFSFTVYHYDKDGDVQHFALVFCLYQAGNFYWWKADNAVFGGDVKDLDIECFVAKRPGAPAEIQLDQNAVNKYPMCTKDHNPVYEIKFVASRPK